MEDNTLRDGWSWMSEDLRLDAEFPLDMSHCLWDDMVDNEVVVRSLFPSNSPDHVEETDPSALSFPQQDSQDCNPAPLKRRRILEFDDENLDISLYLPEPQEQSCNLESYTRKNIRVGEADNELYNFERGTSLFALFGARPADAFSRKCENQEGYNRAISIFKRVKESILAAFERVPKSSNDTGSKRMLKPSIGLPFCIGETHWNTRGYHITGH